MSEPENDQAAQAPQSLKRTPSGVPGLDAVLNGGLFQGSLYLIMGAPGSGKTIFGNQLCFSHIAAGGRALYVTLLTESHTRLITSLQTLSFFDPNAVGDSLLYFSGYSVLAQDGLEGLYSMLRQVIRSHNADLLVLDGMAMIALGTVGEMGYRTFLQRLQTISELQRCTTLLISHQSSRESSAEQVMADGLIELTNRHVGLRVVRHIEVWKLRGSGYLEGLHHCTITSNGLTVYPRTEALFANAREEILHDSRTRFGLPAFDSMLGNGIDIGTSTMLFGVPGSGKTVLGLHFLRAGIDAGEQVLYFGFNETPARLRRNAMRLGIDLESEHARSFITIQWHSLGENIADALVEQLLNTVVERNIKRLFIDGLEGLAKTLVNPERQYGFFAVLVNQLRRLGVTTVFALEMREVNSASIIIPHVNVSETTDNIVCLRYLEHNARLYRLISILKMRDSDYDAQIHEFKISSQGITISDIAINSAVLPVGGQVGEVRVATEVEQADTNEG